MRKQLAKLDGVRGTFTGTVVRFGSKTSYGYTVRTLLLVNVRDLTDNPITDHLWFNLTKGFAALNLLPGDVVQFDARVKPYTKGYQGHREDVFDCPVQQDYKLSHPTKLKKLAKTTHTDNPES
jgi:hypothetical protein